MQICNLLQETICSEPCTDISEVLQNEIMSNATIFKSWEESGNSLSLSYSRRQNLENGDINEILPSLTFTIYRRVTLLKLVAERQKWYQLFGYSYSGQFENTRNKTGGNLKIRGGILHNIKRRAFT